MKELNENELVAVAGGVTKLVEIPAVYTVVEGDNLTTIAAKFYTTWQKIYRLNKTLIDKDAKSHGIKEHFENYIYPGQKLKLR